MILKEEGRYREGDKPHKKGGRPFRRLHVLVRCDKCHQEKWLVKHSFLHSSTYSQNNGDGIDYCQACKIQREVILGTRRKPAPNINAKELIPSRTTKKLRIRSSHGYIRIWINDLQHPRIHNKTSIGGRVYEHILVMEKHLGRYLLSTEQIHHINGDKADNRLENLYLCQDAQRHLQLHNVMQELIYCGIKMGKVTFDHNSGQYIFVNKEDSACS